MATPITRTKPIVPKHVIKVSGKNIKISNDDLPLRGHVVLSTPVVQERGPENEIKVYATGTEDTHEPGRKYVCFFTLRGKGTGFFSIT